MEYLQKIQAAAEAHPWLLLLAVGLVNDIVQRYPGVRAMSLFQVLPNVLKVVFGKVPMLGIALELLDTPQPPALKTPAQPPPIPPAA